MRALHLTAMVAGLGIALSAAPSAGAAPALSAPHTTVLPPDGQNLQGATIVSVGDVNGDKLGDLLIQQRVGIEQEECSSTAFIVLGTFSPSTLRLGALGSRGITITDVPGCIPAWGIAALGDINGDGRGDIGLSGDPYTRIAPTVIFGRAAGSTVSFTAPGTGGLTFTGGSTILPTSIASVGDVNGDGRPDIGLGARYGTLTAGRNAAGVVFTWAGMSGAVDLTRATGLIIGNVSAPVVWGAGGAQLYGVGDLNSDGRADVVTTASGARVVYGRSTPGVIDVGQAGASVPLGEDRYGVFSEIDTMLRPDVNSDGIQELMAENSYAFTLVPSSRTAPHFDLPGTTRPPLTVTASLGFHYGSVVVDDVSGDGKRDLITSAVYPVRNGPFVEAETGGLMQSYLVTDLRPRTLDLRTTTAGVRRFPISEPAWGAVATARFRGTIRPQVVRQAVEYDDGRITVHDVTERADPPADTVPPVISQLAFDRATLSSACADPCSTPERATLSIEVSEAAYLELDLRRGTTIVSRTRGPVWGDADRPFPADGPLRWTVAAVDVSGGSNQKLSPGTYTAALKATDMAGNVGVVKTATIQVTG